MNSTFPVSQHLSVISVVGFLLRTSHRSVELNQFEHPKTDCILSAITLKAVIMRSYQLKGTYIPFKGQPQSDSLKSSYVTAYFHTPCLKGD